MVSSRNYSYLLGGKLTEIPFKMAFWLSLVLRLGCNQVVPETNIPESEIT